MKCGQINKREDVIKIAVMKRQRRDAATFSKTSLGITTLNRTTHNITTLNIIDSIAKLSLIDRQQMALSISM